MSKTICFIFTSADKLLNGEPTGWYLPEAAHPYYVLKPSFNLISASPKGGPVPLDENSKKMFTDDESVKFLEDPEAKKFVAETRKISELDAESIDAVFVVGGHGPMIDLSKDQDFADLVSKLYSKNKLISAVCHGPAALVLAKDPATGKSILDGKKVTGFSNAEEETTPYADYDNVLGFSLEDRLKALSGGHYEGASPNYSEKVFADGLVFTGANPASAKPLAEKIKQALSA